MPDHVNTYSPEDQRKWLYQRGWRRSDRANGVEMWRHPEQGVSYVFTMAMKLAKEDCRLPADYELIPDPLDPNAGSRTAQTAEAAATNAPATAQVPPKA